MNAVENINIKKQMRKVLLVDDEVELTELLGDLLRGNGFIVTTANDGIEALGIAARENFDVVISDIRMPDMDGIQLMEKLKLQFPKLGFVIISGFSTQNEREILKRGAFRFLHKPVSPDQIIEVLHEYFATILN